MRQIAGVIVEQLTTLPGSEVTLRLEIDAEVPSVSVVVWIETTLAPVDLETHLAFCAIRERPQRVEGPPRNATGLMSDLYRF